MEKTINRFLIAILAACIVFRGYLVFVYEINWDEFLNLSMVHDFSRGTLSEPLQTLFVRGFGWVGLISSNEVEQVITTRLVMLVALIVTVALIVWTARRFMPLYAALFAGICFASFSFGLRQGTTFRTDTMATCIIMAAIAILVRHPRSLAWAGVAGGAMGLAGMITIKAIFHVPGLAVICLSRLVPPAGRGRALVYGVVVAVFALAVFVALFLAHRAGLGSPASALAFLDRTTGKTLAESPSVFGRYWQVAVTENLAFAAALLIGAALTLKRLATGPERQDHLVLIGLLLPLASFAYYSETYPYFFPFVLAPAAVVAGIAVSAIPGAVGRRIALAASLLIATQTVLTGSKLVHRDNALQRQVLDTVHRMFPQPMPYIDHAAMASSFPKVGFFMSAWGLADYYARGVPVMAEVLRRDQPRFVLINQPMLSFARLDPDRAGPEHSALFAADIQALRQNFLPHWGPIAIAGKRFDLTGNNPMRAFDIVIAGPYTVEAPVPVEIDGEPFVPGTVLNLTTGRHHIRADGPAVVTLRWGDNIYLPGEPAPRGRLFTGF